jgi:hypothetical protein
MQITKEEEEEKMRNKGMEGVMRKTHRAGLYSQGVDNPADGNHWRVQWR